jgi:hypothetical protein
MISSPFTMNTAARISYRPGVITWLTLPVVSYVAWAYYNRLQRRMNSRSLLDSSSWVDRQNRFSGDVIRSGGGV